MSKKIKFKINFAGITRVRKSEEMKQIIEEKTAKVLSNLGDGYDEQLHYRSTRLYTTVMATTPEARRDNLKHNTLLKALGSGK